MVDSQNYIFRFGNIPRYLEEHDAKTKVLPSYVYNHDGKKWVENDEDKKSEMVEIKELTILSYNIWFADRQWRERQKKLLVMMEEINPGLYKLFVYVHVYGVCKLK